MSNAQNPTAMRLDTEALGVKACAHLNLCLRLGLRAGWILQLEEKESGEYARTASISRPIESLASDAGCPGVRAHRCPLDVKSSRGRS